MLLIAAASFASVSAADTVGVVDLVEALDEFDLSLVEFFGDADGGDFLVCCELALVADSQRSLRPL
jgi:hypothetical protein